MNALSSHSSSSSVSGRPVPHGPQLEPLEGRLLLAATLFPCRQWDVGQSPVCVVDEVEDYRITMLPADEGLMLVSVFPNEADLLTDGATLHVAPRELLLRFSEGQQIERSRVTADDPSGPPSIQLIRNVDGTFDDGNDELIEFAFIARADHPDQTDADDPEENEVIVRFAETLPDDLYRLVVVGAADYVGPDGVAAGPLTNIHGRVLHEGTDNEGLDAVWDFELDLGAQIISVVPQPVSRDATQALMQANDTVVVYFNEDLDPISVETPEFYQLIVTNDTATTADDVLVDLDGSDPDAIIYDPVADKVTLKYPADLSTFGTGAFRLRIGNEYQVVQTSTLAEGIADVGSSFDTATVLEGIGDASGPHGVTISAEIRSDPFPLAMPGGPDEPGHRDIPPESHLNGLPSGVTEAYYNFREDYGTDPASGQPLANFIEPSQEDRAREIFEIYGHYLGIQFVETADQGITVATGDLRVVDPAVPIAVGGISENSLSGRAVMNVELDWGNSEYGGDWFQVAMHQIGHCLGLGEAYDLPPLTIMGDVPGGSSDTGEPVFPGDHDLVHGRYLYPPASTDVDLYQFELLEDGWLTAETVAERLQPSASLLDTRLTLYDAAGEIIAQNDDDDSSDSFLALRLEGGTYYVAVMSTGMTDVDPAVPDTGFGGTTQGQYKLRMNLEVDPAASLLDHTGTLFDGDADGVPGGAFSFWFDVQHEGDTIFVDKANDTTPDVVDGDGSLGDPFDTISAALAAAAAGEGDVVRIVGNAGGDGNLATELDNVAYLIGFDNSGLPLPDGATFQVPQGVTVMIDAGTLLKLYTANIEVGSSAPGIVDRSAGALQVLGTPEYSVLFRSFRDDSAGGDDDGVSVGPAPGDWGGVVFREDSDREDEGIFLNYVSHADVLHGGGAVIVDAVATVYAPIHTIEARPTVVHSVIAGSGNAAISADPNSFEESTFYSTDPASPYTADYGRVGPEVHGNRLVDNWLNGLLVRTVDFSSGALRKLTVVGRWDDTDVVHVIADSLLAIAAAPGGPIRQEDGTLEARPDGRLRIDPGVIVKLADGGIEAEIGAQLIAEGSQAEPIVFTSISDDRYGAGGTFDTNHDGDSLGAAEDWAGLSFAPTSQASIDQAVIAYAGGATYTGSGVDSFNPIEIRQAHARVANTRFEYNGPGGSSSGRDGRGATSPATIFVRGAQPVIAGNDFLDNAQAAISVDVNSLKSDVVGDWGRSTGRLSALDAYGDNHGPLVRENRMTGGGINGMEVRAGTLTTESVWDDTDIAHVVRGEIVVPDFHHVGGLRLQSSAGESLVVKLQTSETVEAGLTATGQPLDIDDRIGGTIQVVGWPDHPVVLTSLADDSVAAGYDLDGNPQGDTNGDASSDPAPGDWRSVRIDRYANSRNVAVANERGAANGAPGDARLLGALAANEKSGNDNQRVGFEVHGTISPDDPADVDVYSFQADAGTEIWIDIDRTAGALDSVVELIEADGTVVAGATSNTDLEGLAQSMIEDELLGGDFYTTNDRDAGMRVVLPGSPGQSLEYFVRVSSQDHLSRGYYRLQVRLRQVDEVPGSTVRHAEIRFAANGVEVLGMPTHSPLIGETAEVPGDTGNEELGGAQEVGNLLVSDLNAISVAGELASAADVDWYQFTIDYDLIQAIAGYNDGNKTWATMFDIDYTDGLADGQEERPDTSLAVFDADGNLILVSRDSNVEDDQTTDAGVLTGGSFGPLDPLIGTQQMPVGVVPAGSSRTYYVAVSSNAYLPTALNATFNSGADRPLTRLEPINSVQRIAEDHIGFSGYTSGDPLLASIPRPPVQDLFDITGESVLLQTHVVPYTLSDVVLFVATPGSSGDLYGFNPFTGDVVTDIGDLRGSGFGYGDIAMRNDGTLFGQTRGNNNSNSGNLSIIHTGDGVQTIIGDDGILTDPNTAGQWEAMAFRRTGDAQFQLFAANNAYADNDNDPATDPPPTEFLPALWRINQDNGVRIDEGSADGVQPVGQLPDLDPDPLVYDPDYITGLAFASPSSGTLYAVSSMGTLWQTTIIGTLTGVTSSGWTEVATEVAGPGVGFTGLALGPQNLDVIDSLDADGDAFPDELPDGVADLAGALFATGDDGRLYAFDFFGNPEIVFDTDGDGLADAGSTHTGMYSSSGLAFSPLDVNLWHPTEERNLGPGHGINDAFDYSRTPSGSEQLVGGSDARVVRENEGGVSFYFGLENWASDPAIADKYLRYHPTDPGAVANAQLGFFSTNGHRDLTSNGNIGENYNLPGGAHGALTTNTFSLDGYTSEDKPTLYFNYFLETEAASSQYPNHMRDSARVFLLTDDGTTWQMLATNNSVLGHELPNYISVSADASSHPSQRIQELFDNTDGWRQARIDLSEFAGQSDLQLRFDFHTAGDTGRGLPGDGFGDFNDRRRGQDNAHEGFYVDDIIIGFAERGEMVTGPSDLADYFQVPEGPHTPDPEGLTGPYQLEIRRGTEYGAVLSDIDPQIAISNTHDTNDPLTREYERLGDRNVERRQDQLQIYANTITDSGEYGILVDAGQRDADSNLPHPGSVRNLPTLNGNRLVPGVNIVNNIVAGSVAGAIYFGGDPNTGDVPDAAVPHGRIVNNTIYGKSDASAGVGIEVAENAAPTILNNVLAGLQTGVSVHPTSSASTVIAVNIYQRVGDKDPANGTQLPNLERVLWPHEPLFVDEQNGDFHLDRGSPAIDSSINSLQDRADIVAVKSPLGIPPSPIPAPEVDRYGQLRVDDPWQNPPPGMGFNVFKDRGAVEAPPVVQVADSSGLPDDARVQFTTALSDFRPGQDDSVLVRPAYPDEKQYIDVSNSGGSALVLREIQINAPDVTVTPALTADLVLQPGETQRFELLYAPTLPSLADPTAQDFDLTDGLVILSNAPAFEVALQGASTFTSDISYDGRVNFVELGVLNVNFGKKAGDAKWDPTADITGDGIVNLEDLGPLNVEFGRQRPTTITQTSQTASTPGGVSTSPQPASGTSAAPMPSATVPEDLSPAACAYLVAMQETPAPGLDEPGRALPAVRSTHVDEWNDGRPLAAPTGLTPETVHPAALGPDAVDSPSALDAAAVMVESLHYRSDLDGSAILLSPVVTEPL